MSVYLKKGKGWRYDFILNGRRHTQSWFKTKTEAKRAEIKRREDIENSTSETDKSPIDIALSGLVKKRLDYAKISNSKNHYKDLQYHGKRWVKEWKDLMCDQISIMMIEAYIIKRSRVSTIVANKELQYLRALFNYGLKRKLIKTNPTTGIDFLPVEKKKKYVPTRTDVLKVILAADPDTQDYLWTILLTAARVGEINQLKWEDVDFNHKIVTLWTRKRKGGNKESRHVPMISKLYHILKRRHEKKDHDLPWVFWHTYWSRNEGKRVKGPYKDRKKIMTTLCKKAGVKYFRFHPLRHLTASLLDDLGIPIGITQRVLGHKNRRTTEIYLHSIGHADREAMEKLESIDLFSECSVVDKNNSINMHKEFWIRKAKRPSYDQLKKEVINLGYKGTGKKYGVSDNAVRKWLKSDL